HTRFSRDWSSDVCSSDLPVLGGRQVAEGVRAGVIGEHLELPAMAVHAHTRVRDALARLDVEDAPAKLCTRRSGGRKQVQNGKNENTQGSASRVRHLDDHVEVGSRADDL